MKISDFTFDSPSSPVAVTARHPVASSDAPDIASRFAEVVSRYGLRPAVIDEDGSLSYAELGALSHRIARALHRQHLAPETRVGIMMERHRHAIAAILGVLEAGGVYVPLEPGLPLERRRLMLELAGAEAIVASAETAGDLQRLEWMCPRLRFSLTLNTDDVESLTEAPGELMSTDLWDHVAAGAEDDVAAGGWKSAFTGLPLSDEAMAAFGANARNKAASLIRPGARVLEVGCASGFTMRHLAPLAASYLALDLSRHNAERVEVVARRLGLTNVTGRQLAAHDIDVLPPGSFDLIVMNSVIESFPGFGYLRSVLDKATTLLAPGGTLFLGSVWDLDRLDAYRADLAAFAGKHAGEGFTTRSDLSGNLFVPRAFVRDWAARRAERPSVAASAVEAAGFEPGRYAFDVVVGFDGRGEGCHTDDRKVPVHLDGRAIAAEPAEPLGLGLTLRQGAYVIFTSGSGGRPKGVLVEQASLVNLVHTIEEDIFTPLMETGVPPPLAVGCVASFAFDPSVCQMFTSLLCGHTVHLPTEDTRRDPQRLHEFIEAHGLHVVDATPSLFAMLEDYWLERGIHSSAKRFLLAGEAVTTTLLDRFYARPGHRDTEVWNLYGPTETSCVVTQHRFTATTWPEIQPPPIGEAIPGVDVMVCDDAGRALPVGIPGEIWLAGVALARGYINDPEQTARFFVVDEQGKRWYRTGDMGRWHRPGLLLFLGREDRQVKVRGYRIELSEVEAALMACPLVRQAAVVVADPRKDGDRVLVAYVVAHTGFDPIRCRIELESRLPSWMVPAWIVCLDALPLTPNGKLDERRLPSPKDAEAQSTTHRARRPFTRDIERVLAGLWQKVLDVRVEDADDDFFQLGGHSVVAVRLVSLIESQFGLRLPLTELFSATTVARMADRIESRREAAEWHPIVAIDSGGTRAPLVCFHPVGGNVLCYKGLADALGTDRPIYMVQSSGLEDGQALQPTVESMVADYLRAFTGVVPDRPLVLLGWSFGGLLAWEAACQLRRVGAVVKSVIVVDGFGASEPIRRLLQQDEAEYLAALFDEMGLGDADVFRRLSPDQRLDLIAEHARGGNYLPTGLDHNHMRRLLALFQNNGLAAVRYRPRPSEARLLLVRPRIASRQAPGIPGDDYSGWGPLAAGGVELCWMDGTHGQMLTPGFVDQLAGHIRRHMDRIGA